MYSPVWTGKLSPKSNSLNFEGNCFKETSMVMDFTHPADDTFTLTVNVKGKRSFDCVDLYVMANTEIFHYEPIAREGTHLLTFKASGPAALVDIQANGIETYLFCEKLKDEILSVITSLKAFIGGLGLHGKIPLFEAKVPAYMEKANIEFQKWALGVDYVER